MEVDRNQDYITYILEPTTRAPCQKILQSGLGLLGSLIAINITTLEKNVTCGGGRVTKNKPSFRSSGCLTGPKLIIMFNV